jgi:hypothetical protein
VKILPVTLFKMLVAAFRKPPVILKIIPLAVDNFEACYGITFSKSQTVIGWWHFQMLIAVPSSL